MNRRSASASRPPVFEHPVLTRRAVVQAGAIGLLGCGMNHIAALRAEAALKDAPAATLAEAIRTVHGGHRAIDPELAADAWVQPDPLTDRERQVLRLAGEGLSNAEIAEQLFLSGGTVRNYLSEAMAKLGVSNRIAAARQARDRGWL